MKTQLLEDIGENAPSSLTPPAQPRHSATGKVAPHLSPASGAPSVPATPQPVQAAAPSDLDSVFEEIAALEAQYVPPAPEPVPTPAEPARPAAREAPPPQPATTLPEPTLAPDPAQGATVPRDPVFDFTMPLPEPQATVPFTPAPDWPRQPRRRSLLWGTGLLSAALVVGGGWWLYEEHSLAGSLALVADGAKEALPVQRAVQQPTIASKQADAPPVSKPAPAVPPLVMLEPESPPPARAASPPPVPAPAEQAVAETASTPEADAQRPSAFPLPKSLGRAARGESDAETKPAPRKVKPEPARQVARTSAVQAVQAERPAPAEGAMTALLRACREHGYHAAQCVKQGCSLTQYGFACRGR